MGLRIAVFDDNKNVRERIEMLLKKEPAFEVVGLFSHTIDCREDILQCRPDLVLIDIAIPGMNGIDVVRIIQKEFPHIQVLVQTIFEDDDCVFDSIIAGASGYILKNQLNTRLIDAIKEVQLGGGPLSPPVARKVLNKLRQMIFATQQPEMIDYQLSVREKEVLACIVHGMSYKMVVDKLNISYDTVRSHVKKIYEKLGVASLTETVAKAIYEKIV
jgi:DNA-binding NarL/FixJ family response regulator